MATVADSPQSPLDDKTSGVNVPCSTSVIVLRNVMNESWSWQDLGVGTTPGT